MPFIMAGRVGIDTTKPHQKKQAPPAVVQAMRTLYIGEGREDPYLMHWPIDLITQIISWTEG
jgi:hypothetical protein